MDLNEWLRGERDWRELWEFKDQFREGSHYRAAKLRAPELVEAMAIAPDVKAKPPPLEDWTYLRQHLATIQDLLLKLIYVSGHTDPSKAPTTPTPELPWEARRMEIMAVKSSSIRAILVPWEVD